ncbi:GvpL/GvpF family gas vesicle protein [Saccharomonospora saliphila]|uniref:GvpL/GvpF family gas vesicle protein n=1 Tax=Saccharomonospora saliphila TaxID=369829 RepID=UPI00037A1181|nr:GvpL/GvpF family gas vesicle protein [Saccharomonospora saliphila]
MSTEETTTREESGTGTSPDGAVYVYGIVPADVETDQEVTGLGDPPGKVSAVRHGDLAALVSDVDADRPLGTPEDLTAHARILDASSAEVPVLPLRFGAVLTDRQAVADELLATHHDEFVAALNELEGRAEYLVKARYDEEAVLREILTDNAEAARLRDVIRDGDPDATRSERMALGELINNEIAARREADTREVLRALEPVAVEVSAREPTHERDAAHVACLAEVAAQRDVEDAVDELAGRWRGRVEVRLLGPLAPYDFVLTGQADG